ncbi:MAG: RagB/SusD family nutrient uptake outer membrane protein [Bacteroidota bacterium]
MSRFTQYLLVFGAVLTVSSCEEVLTPKPVDIISDELVLNAPNDVANVEIGLYSAFRGIITNAVISGDFTADMLLHNGTFSQYRELGTKQITAANASAAAFWSNVYSAVYVANFIFEKLPGIQGVPTAQRNKTLGTAHLLRGLSYFYGLYTFGGIPNVQTTLIDNNRNIPRAGREELLALIEADFNEALELLPAEPVNAGFVGKDAARAAMARYFLYTEQWAQAENMASAIISSAEYQLPPDFSDVVLRDFTTEAIFEIGYNITDDPGTLNNLFKSRREIIPSNQTVVALASDASGDRFRSIEFRVEDLGGSDNGWTVSKYGTADEDNNNVVVFRLAEMHLIRAEARARQNKVTGANSAEEDVNILRARANAPLVQSVSQNEMLQLIEDERRMELAFEGHRWYDLVRTGRANTVMTAFSPNWRSAYELWPIPQTEIQNNPSLVGQQNPGY